MRFEAAGPGVLASAAHAPVVAVSDGPPIIVAERCSDTDPDDCELRRYVLSELSAGSAMMVTSTGRFVVAIDQHDHTVYSWEVARLDAPDRGRDTIDGSDHDSPRILLASLRASDWLIVRDNDGDLMRVHPQRSSAEPIAPSDDDLKLVAVGHSYAAARRVLDGSREELVLLPVDPELDYAGEGPVPLVRADNFTQVELTADDGFVVATSGTGDDAETFVFTVPEGTLVDRFVGAAVPGVTRLENVPGLRASSPDGTHLAYRTASGALALRGLHDQSACLVRSRSGGDHSVAGFAADGMMYMQADLALGESRLFAFDGEARRLVALDRDGAGHHLAAVPDRLPVRGRPWALGVRDGRYAAVQGTAEPAAQDLDGPVFAPRQGADLWVATSSLGNDARRWLSIRRVSPRVEGSHYRFADANTEAAAPTVVDTDGDERDPVAKFSSGERPCLSTGTPGAWAYTCGSASSREYFAVGGLPGSEDPTLPDADQPELPQTEPDGTTGDGGDGDTSSSGG